MKTTLISLAVAIALAVLLWLTVEVVEKNKTTSDAAQKK